MFQQIKVARFYGQRCTVFAPFVVDVFIPLISASCLPFHFRLFLRSFA